MFFDRLTKMLSDVFHPRPKYITVTPVTSAPVAALPPSRLPKHVAIIMDGNGRWATNRGMSRSAGHAAGTEALRDIIRASDDWGIEALSLYAFSTENWARSKEEVGALMALLLKYFSSEIDELDEKNVRITILGDVNGLPVPQREAVVKAMERTKDNTGLKLNIALNYGGRAELVRAARLLAEKVKAGEMAPEDITEATFGAQLYTADSPDVDLLIRTSGEMRTSNFLPWQTTYAEMVFESCLWPDFTRERYMKCLQIYAERDRRFGGVKTTRPEAKAAETSAPTQNAEEVKPEAHSESAAVQATAPASEKSEADAKPDAPTTPEIQEKKAASEPIDDGDDAEAPVALPEDESPEAELPDPETEA